MHHAYVYEGLLGELDALVADARERFGFVDEHGSDVHVRSFEKFGIDESRWLTTSASLKSSAGRALFVVGISSLTSESQQALLKLFEEPQQGTMFILLVPHGSLLATLRSRVMAYPDLSPVAEDNSPQGVEAKKFLKMAGKERSEFITKMLKDDEDTKERVREFVNALEAELYNDGSLTSVKTRQGLGDIALVRNYLGDRSPSLKMLLEHLALCLPTL